jgi:hypothetical protein
VRGLRSNLVAIGSRERRASLWRDPVHLGERGLVTQ